MQILTQNVPHHSDLVLLPSKTETQFVVHALLPLQKQATNGQTFTTYYHTRPKHQRAAEDCDSFFLSSSKILCHLHRGGCSKCDYCALLAPSLYLSHTKACQIYFTKVVVKTLTSIVVRVVTTGSSDVIASAVP